MPNVNHTFNSQMQNRPLAQSLIAMDNISVINTSETQKYQRLLAKMSTHQIYQYLLVAFICSCWLVIVFNAMIGSFVFMNPLFQCNQSSASEKQACLQIQKCKITNNFTAASRNFLYCENSDIRSTIQSVFGMGCVVGMFLLPVISDMIGRRRAVIFAFLVGIFALSFLYLGIVYYQNIVIIIGSCVAGIFGSGLTMVGYLVTCDFCQETLRQRYLMLYCAMWGVGEVTFYFLFNYMPEWDKYMVYLLIFPTTILFVLALFFFLETPVFAIFVKKDYGMFCEIVQKLKIYNKISDEDLNEIKKQGKQMIQRLKVSNKSETKVQQSLKKIIKNKKTLLNVVCLTITLVSFNFFYYGMQGSMQRTGYSFGSSMLLVGIHQFLAYFSASYLTKYIRRKRGAIFSIFITSAIGLTFLISYVKQQLIIQSMFVSITRVTSVYAYSFILLMQSQLLQVQIRSIGVAIIDGVGQSGRIVVPFVINLMNNLGISTLIVSSIIFLVAGTLPILPLKETWRGSDVQGKLEGIDVVDVDVDAQNENEVENSERIVHQQNN